MRQVSALHGFTVLQDNHGLFSVYWRTSFLGYATDWEGVLRWVGES